MSIVPVGLYGSDRTALLALRAPVKNGPAVTAVVPDDRPLFSKAREVEAVNL